MAAGAAAPGLFFTFAATVLLLFVCISAPTWNKISFLDVGQGGTTTHFGILGYTGSRISLGYYFNFTDSHFKTAVIHNLTKTLILHPIACGLAGLAFLFGLCGAAYHRIGTILMTLLASLATLATFVAFIIDMVLFGIARKHFRQEGLQAQYGNANWLTLGAFVALMIGTCTAGCGVFGRYRKNRRTGTY